MGANFWQSWVRGVESVKLAEDQRLSLASSAATGYLTQENVILSDGLPLDVFDEQAYLTALQGSRAQAANFLNSFGGELAAVFAELSKVIAPVAPASTAGAGVAFTDPTSVLPVLYNYMATATAAGYFRVVPRVNSRGLTYGTPTYGGSNVGNGTLYRLTVDAYGFNMEGGFAETKNMICTADAQSGTIIGQEQFSVFGQPFRDPLTWFASGYGSGGVWTGNAGLIGVTADTTQPLVQNSSFAQSTGTGGTSDFALTGWTQTAGLAASMSLDTTNYYRAAAIEGTTPAALKATASVTIKQLLSSNAGALANTAYLSRLAVNFSQFSGTGSVTVQIGSQSWTVNSGVAGWNLLLPTRDANLWFKNFNTAALAVTITITVSGGTAILVDDFCWSPMTAIDGTMWWLIGGSTAFRVNDTAQAVDTEPSPPSKVQNWIRLMFPGYYLPSAVQPTRPTTAPTLAVGAAGIVTAGTHVGYYSYVIGATGAESGLSPVSNVVLSNGSTQVDFSGVTAGGAGVTARNLYLSKTGGRNGVDLPYYVGQIADNVTTTASVNLADASLTALPGPIGDPL